MLIFKPYPLLLTVALSLVVIPLKAAEYVPWTQQNFAIENSLSGSAGDPDSGLQLVTLKSKGNCIACHRLPIKDLAFQGTIGPELTGVGKRLTVPQIRLRVVDEKQINPYTIMPGYHADPQRFNRVSERYRGEAILSAQEIEDIVAYLGSLK
ncbi:MAG: sulfur oxidation c-type cytochrome SoxX [Gammaproteobacteria bacterium]|nr:sulfur oxidation c-type cytochrome SoxX [Gammaproteobacteria bacterium]